MVCCRIFTNFDEGGSFSGLLNSLVKHGNILWNEGCLYFADVSGDMTEAKVATRLKKNGFPKFFIDVYSKTNQPKSVNEIVDSWLSDKLIKITYQEFEQKNQETFREISAGLDMLEKELDRIVKNKVETSNKEDGHGNE